MPFGAHAAKTHERNLPDDVMMSLLPELPFRVRTERRQNF
jgi:hypothetical protein